MVPPIVSFVTACIACTGAVVMCQNKALGHGCVTFDTQPLITTHLGFRLTDKASLTEVRKLFISFNVKIPAIHYFTPVVTGIRKGNDSVIFDGVLCLLGFDGVMRQAVHQLKYRNLRAVAVPLARLMNDYLIANPVPGEVLVPVPLHQKRLRERGYNQSGLLAGGLGKLTGLPVVTDCLVRQRHALPQARTSSVDERRRNVADVFSCCDRRLRDKQVLLIDDVATSGATMDACAAALKASGAVLVWGLVLAREI